MACDSSALFLRRELSERIIQAKELFTHCSEKLEVQGKEKLLKKIQAELCFLEKLSNSVHLKADHVRSSNLTHLSSIVKCCSEMQDSVKILQSFMYRHEENHNCIEKRLMVDVVSDHGKTWVKVIARNPIALLQLSSGNGKFGQKSVIAHVKDMIECAKQNIYMFEPPKVKVWFSGGFLKELHDLFNGMDVEVIFSGEMEEGSASHSPIQLLPLQNSESLQNNLQAETEILAGNRDFVSSTDQFSHLWCGMMLCSIPSNAALNLDVSTMIAHVSNLTNGSSHANLKEPILADQAKRERISPVRDILNKLFNGRTLICCKTAFSDFKDIVSCVGGTNEKQRALEFSEKLTVVPDNPSQQALILQESSRIKPRSKIIFGTGDSCKAVTVTANFGFLRAAEGQGVKFAAVFHESRALTEMKELP